MEENGFKTASKAFIHAVSQSKDDTFRLYIKDSDCVGHHMECDDYSIIGGACLRVYHKKEVIGYFVDFKVLKVIPA